MGLRWLKATLLWCATVKCDDYTLIEVKSKNGDANSIKICAAFNGDVSSILDGSNRDEPSNSYLDSVMFNQLKCKFSKGSFLPIILN